MQAKISRTSTSTLARSPRLPHPLLLLLNKGRQGLAEVLREAEVVQGPVATQGGLHEPPGAVLVEASFDLALEAGSDHGGDLGAKPLLAGMLLHEGLDASGNEATGPGRFVEGAARGP